MMIFHARVFCAEIFIHIFVHFNIIVRCGIYQLRQHQTEIKMAGKLQRIPPKYHIVHAWPSGFDGFLGNFSRITSQNYCGLNGCTILNFS